MRANLCRPFQSGAKLGKLPIYNGEFGERLRRHAAHYKVVGSKDRHGPGQHGGWRDKQSHSPASRMDGVG